MSRNSAIIGVSTHPGHMALTLIPLGMFSRAGGRSRLAAKALHGVFGLCLTGCLGNPHYGKLRSYVWPLA